MANFSDSRPILIAGLGSIGYRHFRNLRQLGTENLILFRTGKTTLPMEVPDQYRIYSKLENALAERPVAVIISNPTALHIPTALKAAEAGCHIFLEKPISHNLNGIQELDSLGKDKELCIFTGFQFRFHPLLIKLRKWLQENEIGDIISTQAYWGENVTDWHPWEDYRNSYSVKSDLGGGVILTLSHPIDYLRWLVGDIQKVYAVSRKPDGIISDAESVAQMVFHFTSGAIGSLYLDYFQRPIRHTMEVVGSRGKCVIDLHKGTAALIKNGKTKAREFVPKNFERNSMFLREMAHFLDCVRGDAKPLCSFHDGLSVLKIIHAAKQSSSEGREINVK